MAKIMSLSRVQERLLEACKEKSNGSSLSLRNLAKKNAVPYSSLQKAVKRPPTASAILSASHGRGRKERLTSNDEQIIFDAITEFQCNGTPLDRCGVMDIAKAYVESLPATRRAACAFKNNRPGRKWLINFLKRHPVLRLKSTVNLEHERAEAMCPENVAAHFARIRALADKHDITEPFQVFNLDESGFSIKGMSYGSRSKRIVRNGSRANARQLKWRGTCDHVTLMAVVNAAGQSYTPLVVLPGVQARYRRRTDGRYETPADFLPVPNYLFMREVAGVDTDIFYSWALNFVEETAHLRRNGRKLLLVYDGYAGHLKYKVLSLLKTNGIIVAGLPAHTSHALQPLDVGVFGPLKQAFRMYLSRRTVITRKDTRNDVFTICELLKKSYYDALTPVNIMKGFRRSGLWSEEKRGPDMDQIRSIEYTSPGSGELLAEGSATRSRTAIVGSSDEPHMRIENARQLYNVFLSKAEKLVSDGTIEVNGTVCVTTKSGATLTSDNVIAALKAADDRKRESETRKKTAAVERVRRRAEREAEEAAKRRRRSEREEEALQKLKAQRAQRQENARQSRRSRRERTRRRIEQIHERSAEV